MKNLFSKIGVFLCVAMLSGNAAGQKIDIVIDGGAVRGIPTAIVPFKAVDGNPLPHAVHEVVADDLRASGKFDPVDSQNFLSLPSRAEEVRFKDWRFINVEALVIGEVWTLGEDRYEVQFRIYDVARQAEIGTGKRIPNLSGADLRTAGHIISDNVYQAFTGKPALFNSRIVYKPETVAVIDCWSETGTVTALKKFMLLGSHCCPRAGRQMVHSYLLWRLPIRARLFEFWS